MSDAQRPDNPDLEPGDGLTDVDGNPLPDPEVLAEQALPAIYNRSPRLVQVVGTAIGGGFVLGFVVGLLIPTAKIWGVLISSIMTGLAFALVLGLIAGIMVVTSEARTARRVERARREVISEWVATHPDATFDDVVAGPDGAADDAAAGGAAGAASGEHAADTTKEGDA